MAPQTAFEKARSKQIMSGPKFAARSVSNGPKNPHHGPMNRYPALRPPTRKVIKTTAFTTLPLLERNRFLFTTDLSLPQFKEKWWRTKRNENGCEGFNPCDEVPPHAPPPPGLIYVSNLNSDPTVASFVVGRCFGFVPSGKGTTSVPIAQG